MSAARKAKRKARRKKIGQAIKKFVKGNKADLVDLGSTVARMVVNNRKKSK